MKDNMQSAIDIWDRRRVIRGLLLAMAYMLLPVASLLILASVSEPADSDKVMEDIKQALLKELSFSVSPDVELAGLRIVRGIDIGSGNINYTVSAIAMNSYVGRNKMNFAVSLKDKAGNTQQLMIEASYDVLADVFVSSKAIQKGAVMTADSFYSVKQKMSRLPSGAVLKKEDIEGKILKMNISQGVIVRSEHLANFISMKKGHKVDVVVEGANVLLTTKGVLRSDVTLGGTAAVFCDTYKKEVNGILVDASTVRVKI